MILSRWSRRLAECEAKALLEHSIDLNVVEQLVQLGGVELALGLHD